MKVNIYYGGRGLIEDPTIYVMNKLMEVLGELRVEVTKYNLYEDKNGITTLPKTLKEADAIILATNLEWWGIGGYMQQFLDACWLYGDKEHIAKLYMMPVVMSNTYGEQEAQLSLVKAWEVLGGIPCDGLCAYVSDHVEFETNPSYKMIIEKKAEMLYRCVNQKQKGLPSSSSAINHTVLKNNTLELTPQESEQLSMYVSDDTYVKKQKEDIEELSSLFKEMLGTDSSDEYYIKELKAAFQPLQGFSGSFEITITDKNKVLIVEINGEELNCYYGNADQTDVQIKTSHSIMESITKGRTTLQKAFMTGELSAKGNFKLLRNFDSMFVF
ncbi:SCP2 sterol-binding domain-containing protein [Anaerosporobacter faecicola]|uniref:SCP2 sterol-binding domain-containing protein n=1 Tax=Anaerosporobacter faecicola TaxID=2718714 RepID=UPI001438A92D|nr:SCP2 sterol-binding domain-containing protein [Anaerosporobacter faecicola]